MTQYARPSSDITTTGITGVGSATLWQNVDESSANDSDYNWSTINAVRTYECKLSSVSLGGSGSYVVKYRLVRVLSGGSLDVDEDGNDFAVTVSLVQNTTVIASEVRNTSSFASSGVWNEYTLTLTSPQVASITDGADLRLRFVTTASGGSGSSRAGMGVSFCEFAIPDAPVEQYAVKNGNYNDPTVWSTGAVPTTGTVYSNNYTVTVNVNSAATIVTNVAGTVAVAGGSFVLSNGVTLTANVYAGATTCVTLATGITAGVVGNAYGGSLSNTYGVNKSGTGTFTLTGNCYGGTGSHGVINSSSGTVAISGHCYGSDTNSSAYGARNASSGTLTVGGSVYAGAAAPGLALVSTGTTSIAGSVYAVGSVVGMLHGGSTNNVTIEGDVVGGTTILAYGLQCTSTGNATVLGSAISPASPGVGPGIGVTGTGTATIGHAVTGTGCGSPCVGHVHVADLDTSTVEVRSTAAAVVLSDEVDLPSPFQPASVFGAV